jgi:hypothetical protein
MQHSGNLDPATMVSDAMTIMSTANGDFLVRKLSIFLSVYTK